MENPVTLKKKDLKKNFKEIYPNYDGEKTKVVSLEDAVKIVVESMEKSGGSYTGEQAMKILSKFDVGNTGKIAKNEVKKSLMIAARLEVMNEKMIIKMKKKWEKKQNKKKKASKEEKKKAKLAKKALKKAFKEVLGEVGKYEWVSFNDAEKLIGQIMVKVEMPLSNEEMTKLMAQLDEPKNDAVHKKEIKLICKHLTKRREIDFEKANYQRAKWMATKEKKEQKRAKKEEKKQQKLNKKLEKKQAQKPAETPKE